MDATGQLAPPVVAVMVVNEPGNWFDEVLDGLAEQDYGNLRSLFLVSGDPGTLPARIRERVPNSFVRAVDGNPGFGPAANDVLGLVEGENGFFCFLHDDVALEPDAVRLLVEELYRSNAGIVGPKLVSWRDAGVLQHVGLGVDRFGEIDPLVEPGELDQEQHDAVTDVFALPSACLLVRADLFRALGGFDPTIEFHGEDLDLCWRAHLNGARVVVVPAASARHVEGLPARRPDLPHEQMRARHRMRAVATLTGARHLPLVVVQLVVLTITELLAGLVTGTFRQGWAGLRSLLGLVPRLPAVFARRRAIAPLRVVPSSEVAGLQIRGSARFSAFLRSRGSRVVDPEASTERRWRQTAGSAPAVAWAAVLALVVVGSRELITGGVPAFGEFLPYPSSPRGLLTDYRSGWWGHGLGSAAAVPAGVALVALGSVATLFRMGLWHTVSILGLLVVGQLGMWRLGSLFPTARARITGLVVYAAVPLPVQLLSVGRWGALCCYAAAPWTLHLLRRAVGVDTMATTNGDEVERLADVSLRRRVRAMAQLSLVVAVTIAFAPGFLLVVVLTGVLLGVGTLLAAGSWRVAAGFAGGGLVAAVGGLLADLPWSFGLFGDGWTAAMGVPPVTSRSLGIGRLAQFDLGNGRFGVLAIALFAPVAVALVVSRSWRLTWSVRAAALVVGFGWLAVADDADLVGWRLPEPGVLLAPVAVGVALAAACLVAAMQDDVLSGSFGWRQPLGLLAVGAIGVGVLPGALSVANGRWHTPELTLTSVLGQLPADPPEGDYRVLWLGSPEVMPVAAWTYRPGIAYAITDDGPLTFADALNRAPTEVEVEVARVLDLMGPSGQSTLRAGRLLAPFAVRYVVVPLADGAVASTQRPLSPPSGLIDALDDQLDLARPLTRPLNFIVYENTAWTPTRSVLTPAGAEASRLAGAEALAQADLSGSLPFAVGSPDRGAATDEVDAGTVHVAVPFDRRWSLTVDGVAVAPRRAFGSTMAFDAGSGGSATLRYDTSTTRTLLLVLQAAVWAVLLLAATRTGLRSLIGYRRRRRAAAAAALDPVLSLRDPMPQPEGGSVPWTEEPQR